MLEQFLLFFIVLVSECRYDSRLPVPGTGIPEVDPGPHVAKKKVSVLTKSDTCQIFLS
jgi:hypothetical protein